MIQHRLLGGVRVWPHGRVFKIRQQKQAADRTPRTTVVVSHAHGRRGVGFY